MQIPLNILSSLTANPKYHLSQHERSSPANALSKRTATFFLSHGDLFVTVFYDLAMQHVYMEYSLALFCR